VKRHPEYPEGLVMLGAGYENMGVSIRVNGDPDAVAKSAQMYETAGVYYRRAIELKGEGADFDMMRGLVDLHDRFDCSTGPCRPNAGCTSLAQ
jgi:hypothetical protein